MLFRFLAFSPAGHLTYDDEEARDNRDGDEREWGQLFGELGGQFESGALSLAPNVPQDLEELCDGLIDICGKPMAFASFPQGCNA